MRKLNLLLTILYPAIICIVAYNIIGQELTKEVVAGFSSMTVATTTISSLISQLARAFAEVQNSSVEVKVAFDLLKMQGKIETDSGTIAENFETLEVKNITFSYKEDYNQLENVSLKIKKGQRIGYMSDSGDAYGKHLHFEVLENNKKEVCCFSHKGKRV